MTLYETLLKASFEQMCNCVNVQFNNADMGDCQADFPFHTFAITHLHNCTIPQLHNSVAALADKLRPKVYEYGFLK